MRGMAVGHPSFRFFTIFLGNSSPKRPRACFVDRNDVIDFKLVGVHNNGARSFYVVGKNQFVSLVKRKNT